MNKVYFGWHYACRMMLLCLLMSVVGCATTQPSGQSNNKEASVDLFLISVDAHRAYQESRWLDAVRLYQQIIEHAPNDAVAWFKLANTYAQQGAFEPAAHAYEQSLVHDSEQPKAWFNLSTVYLLNAQSSMQQSYERMRIGDPARELITIRLARISDLLHGRADESVLTSAGAHR